jgi:hypothetical protein
MDLCDVRLLLRRRRRWLCEDNAGKGEDERDKECAANRLHPRSFAHAATERSKATFGSRGTRGETHTQWNRFTAMTKQTIVQPAITTTPATWPASDAPSLKTARSMRRNGASGRMKIAFCIHCGAPSMRK